MKNKNTIKSRMNRPLKFSPLTRTALLACLVVSLVSCGGAEDGGNGEGEGNVSSFTKHAALISNSADIMNAGYIKLASSTSVLKIKIDEYCADATSIADQTKKEAAEASFKLTMNDLQYSLQHSAKSQGIGPALDIERGIEVVYSWPLANSCRIDGLLAESKFEPGNPINRRGLDALEHLLFVAPESNHSCSTQESQLTAFNDLSTEEKQLRRCKYMKNVIADVVITTNKIKDGWDPAIGDHLGEMKNSNIDVLVTLNKVSDAMYYIADVGKEDKLDQPMGGGRTNTTPSCGVGVVCPADVESPNSKISLDNLIANVTSFQELFHGGDVADKATNVGFDDWLEAEGEATIATKMTSDIAKTLTELNKLKVDCTTLQNAITSCKTQLDTFFDGAFQSVTRGFRDDVLPKLGLQPPQASLTDND